MKKAIIFASFGCSIKESRQTYIETVENAVKSKFENIDCFSVFTSEIIRKKIYREENIFIDNMESCLKKLKDENYSHVYILSSHIIPGFEYEKIINKVDECKNDFAEIKVSRTFLDDGMGEKEISAVKSYIKSGLGEDEAVVLVGHGSDHEAHKYYKQFEELLNSDCRNIFIINVEGDTYMDEVSTKMQEMNVKKAYIYPFMVVAGDHAINDIASDEEDSIKSYFEVKGFYAEAFITGLGNNKKSIELFVNRIADIM